MTRSIAPADVRQERLFVLALLLALASALIPALFPAGSPMGRVSGSAFDPTTSTVTLRGRDQAVEPARILAEPDSDRVETPRHPLMVPASTPVATARLADLHPGANPSFEAVPLLRSDRSAQARPRAPPLRTF